MTCRLLRDQQRMNGVNLLFEGLQKFALPWINWYLKDVQVLELVRLSGLLDRHTRSISSVVGFPGPEVNFQVEYTGMINASVLPLPVFAAPRMSFPFNANGSAFRCMSVKVVKCASFSPVFSTSNKTIPCWVCCDSGNSLNNCTLFLTSFLSVHNHN